MDEKDLIQELESLEELYCLVYIVLIAISLEIYIPLQSQLLLSLPARSRSFGKECYGLFWPIWSNVAIQDQYIFESPTRTLTHLLFHNHSTYDPYVAGREVSCQDCVHMHVCVCR